jgi:RNA polymerase sigma factor (sigma-70 family)
MAKQDAAPGRADYFRLGHPGSDTKMGETPFEQFVIRLFPALTRYFYSRTRNVEDAEDLAVQVLVAYYDAVMRHARIDDSERFCWCIAKRRWIDHLRSSRLRPEPVELKDDLTGGSSRNDRPVEEAIEETERRAALWRAIAALPDPLDRLLVTLHLLGYKPREIAAMLTRSETKISAKTVSNRLSLAKKELLRILEAMDQPSQP